MAVTKSLRYIAFSLIMLCFSFTFDSSGVVWLWKDLVQVPGILSGSAVILTVVSLWIKGTTTGKHQNMSSLLQKKE